jgi:hypothetical protein
MTLRQKDRISDTNKPTLYLVGGAAEAFGLSSMRGSDLVGESHEKRYRSSSAG